MSNSYSAMDDTELIAEELCPKLYSGKTLAELRRELRETSPSEKGYRNIAYQLHELFAAAARERYVRMGVQVKPGNAASARMREPGEDSE